MGCKVSVTGVFPENMNGFSIDDFLQKYEVPKEQAHLLQYLKCIYGLEIVCVMNRAGFSTLDYAHTIIELKSTNSSAGKISITLECNCVLRPKERSENEHH